MRLPSSLPAFDATYETISYKSGLEAWRYKKASEPNYSSPHPLDDTNSITVEKFLDLSKSRLRTH